MLLFCTILRRNYPARLNGQGLKSQATFTIFLSSFFIFVFHFFSLFLFFSFLLFFSFSFFGDLSRARRGITILISPRDFYRFLSHSVPLNERPPFNPPSSGEYDRRLSLFTELPTFFVSIFFSLSLSLGLPSLPGAWIWIYTFVHHRSIIPSIDRLSSVFGRNFPVVPPQSSRRNEIDRGDNAARFFSRRSGQRRRNEKRREKAWRKKGELVERNSSNGTGKEVR